MPVPTTEEKLRFLKPEPPTPYELECMDRLRAGEYEIGVQEINDIVDEGMQVFERCCRTSFGVTGDSIVAIFTAQGDLANGPGRLRSPTPPRPAPSSPGACLPRPSRALKRG